MEQPEWMTHAWSEAGVSEVPGNRDNPRVMAFYADVGHRGVAHDEVAWCAAFAGACLERAGFGSTRSLSARSYLSWGEEIAGARPGAIAVLSRGSNPALGHVGFLVGESREKLFLLGGNQSNAVRVSPYAKSRLIGLRWPLQEQAIAAEAVVPAGIITIAETALFAIALEHVLEMEGGYTDDPHDPGGATNFGITIGVYAREKNTSLGADNIAALKQELQRISPQMVRDIYWRRYWRLADCGKLPAGVAIMHFDAAVNQGAGRATRMLQEAVGAEIDGEFGPLTLAATIAQPVERTLGRYADIRRRHYRGLSHFWRFGRGWLRRVDVTLALARAQPGQKQTEAATPMRSDNSTTTAKETVPMTSENATPKATGNTPAKAADPAAPAATKWWGESITIWGVMLTALSTVLPALGPLIGLDVTGEMVRQLGEQIVQVVEAAGGVIGTLMAIYGRMQAKTTLVRQDVTLKL